ncbi:MAG: DUF2974 domain-containing protein [Eubacteriaceae bacterium]|jgi:hypothetical protein|nr:DUF2974 domain-containing protein [Eubacteriaceae bacterium]
MNNLFTFLDKYGDIGMDSLPFCDVDALIASHIAYMPFDGTIGNSIGYWGTVGSTLQKVLSSGNAVGENDKNLALRLIECSRYRSLSIGGYVNIFSDDRGEQFSAVSVLFGDGRLGILFRGTDGTITGWKEDFNMSFMRQIPSQESAVSYLLSVAKKTVAPIRLIGHSKGGNLAIFAACFSGESIRLRIEKVYNLDGPGFLAETVADPRFKAMLPKLATFVPQSSVIGMLLEHVERYVVVRSSAQGVLQHDVYSWETRGNGLVYLESVDGESKFLDSSLRGWLSSMSMSEREQFVDMVFQVLDSAGIKTVKDLVSDWPGKLNSVMEAMAGMSDNMRRFMGQMLLLLLKSATMSLPNILAGEKGRAISA